MALHRHRPSDAARTAALACGERLLATAVRDERGTGWRRPGEDARLTGFGHGTAGVAWALLQLASWSGEERFRAVAREAMAYERGWFCPERGNWPDLRASRGDAAGRPFLHAWCHGGPGIGLGRLASAPHVDDDAIGEEVAAAVATTLDQGFGQNHSLCHGDLGNLDLLWKASHPAAGMAARILAGIERGGWRCGVGVRTEVPGLMVGLAGIGYGLLRAAAPATTPSVLLLETPAAADKRAKPTAL